MQPLGIHVAVAKRDRRGLLVTGNVMKYENSQQHMMLGKGQNIDSKLCSNTRPPPGCLFPNLNIGINKKLTHSAKPPKVNLEMQSSPPTSSPPRP